MSSKLTEKELRELRDRVFGDKTSDNNWNHCKSHWADKKETQFLLDQAAKLDKLGRYWGDLC